MWDIFVQGIGFLGAITGIVSFQCKSTRYYYLLQTFCSFFFSLQFFCIGAWAGLLFNLFGIARGVLFRNKKLSSTKTFLAALWLYLILAWIVSVLWLNQSPWTTLIIFTAQASSTFTMWRREGKLIRILQLSVVSPCWITFDLLLTPPSLGGILCEAFNVVSVIISLIRFRKTGFAESKAEG